MEDAEAPNPSPPLPFAEDDQERLAQLFEQAPSLMAMLREPEHRIVLANRAFLRLVGQKDIIGKRAEEVLPSALAEDAVRALNEAYRTGRPSRQSEVRFPAGNGNRSRGDRLLDLILQPITDRNGQVMGIFIEGSDVTDRVHAEQRLRSSFAIKTVGIIYWDAEFRLTEVNDAFSQMTGFTRDEAIGKSWRELTPQEFWPTSERAVAQLNATGEAMPYEKQYFRKDGCRWWGLFAARRVSPDEVVEFVLDITERLNAEHALRDREQRLRLIVDSATDYAILTTDTDRRVTSWSPGAERTFGYPADEIIGQSADLLFTPEDRAFGVPAQEADLARNIGSAPDVRWHVRKDGSQVFVNGSSNVLRSQSGAELGFLKIARDETERRRAEIEIRDAEERYRLAAAATNDAIWDWDLVSDSVRWNDAVEVLFGYTEGEVGPTSAWWKSRIHAEDRDRVIAAIQAVIADADTGWSAEYRFERKDGSYAEVLDRGTVLRAGGRPARMVGAIHDLSPHKRAEATLRQLNETLEHRVLEEVTARMKTEDALRQSQKLEAIGQLTGGVAHDFNNLLTVIRGAAEMLKRPTITDDKRTRYVDAIADTADRAAKLTGQLLAFSRRQALKPEVINAGERIEIIRDMLATVVGSGVRLTVDTDCEICYIEADPSQFETALVNMAVNARDAMEGTGELKIGVEPTSSVPRIRGHGAAGGEFVAICISDTGSGIPPDQLAQIFEPFFTTKEIGKGTGLGLSQVYGFAKQSGGEIDVESVTGEGATFTLYLPRISSKLGLAAAVKTDAEQVEGRGHILVVEDNEQVGAFSTQLLSELGFETTWAPSADAALKLLAEQPHHYAAVFSDVVMPGMNGVELGLEIRRREPGLPIILTSGYSHVLAQEGSHGFELLHKPYSIEDLTRVLRRVIVQRSGTVM